MEILLSESRRRRKVQACGADGGQQALFRLAENAPIAKADDYAAYCSDYPSDVTPLVVSDAAGYEKAMVVGVNRRARIVYHGDANLNQNGRLSSQANTDGTVTTDFDRLTANLWAWIVEQVCGQE